MPDPDAEPPPPKPDYMYDIEFFSISPEGVPLVLDNDPIAWGLATAVALIILAIGWGLRRVGARLAAGRRDQSWLRAAFVALSETHWGLIVLLSVAGGVAVLSLPPALRALDHMILTAGIMLQAALWGTTLVQSWADRKRKRIRTKNPAALTALELTRVALLVGVWAAAAVIGLDAIGINVTALMAGLGIGGIAIALAAQSVLGDLLASVSIALDKPFVVGDFLDTGSEFKGTVEHIGLKTTRLRSLSGEEIVLSNADLLNSRIRNYGRMEERRVPSTLGVTYQTPRAALEAIPDLIRKAVEARGEAARFDRAHLARFGNSAIEFDYVYFVTSPDFVAHMDVQQAINLDLHAAFAQVGADFAYPTQTVFLRRDGGEEASA